jgi:hypothetical protein
VWLSPFSPIPSPLPHVVQQRAIVLLQGNEVGLLARQLHGLSPALDNGVIDRLRPVKFKTLDGVSEAHLQGLLFQIIFHATCTVPSVYNIDE